MNRIEIIKIIKTLSQSQGYYCRLYNQLMYYAKHDPVNFNEYMATLERENFSDAVDVIKHFEG